MKKVITIALCMVSVGCLSAQKVNVDNAKKLSGKFDKIEEARNLIQQAILNEETSNDATTYYVAGKIEFDAYDKGVQAGMINPEDPSAQPVTMAQELLNGYGYFLKSLPLDSVPNAKGEIKPKHAKEIVSKIAGHASDFFKAGAFMYEAGKYYPEAYEGFYIYSTLPDQAYFGNKAPKIENADRAQSFFNAGLSAYSGNEILKAADAFAQARKYGFDDANAYIYEIACWQNLAQRDSTMEIPAQNHIFQIANAGYEKFGIEQPIFLNNLVNTLVQEEKYDEAIDKINALLTNNPQNANLYGLLGFIYDRKGDNESSITSYKNAAAAPDCDFETLKNATKKYYRVGITKLEEIAPNDRDGKMKVKAEYFDVANDLSQRAKAMNGNDSDLQYVIDNIEYALQTYF